MSNIILEARTLQKTYVMGDKRLQVLRGVNLKVPRGTFVSIVGASGSGKSTLLHLLGVLDHPDGGAVLYEGEEITGLGARRQDALRATSFGFVFQLYHLLPEFNVLENTMFPAMITTSSLGWPGKKGDAVKRASTLLDELGLGQRLKHRPGQLSGGEQQRVAIARALMNDPPVLLCDEPTGNLDPKTGARIIDELTGIHKARRKTLVMVTHDHDLAARADLVFELREGKLHRV